MALSLSTIELFIGFVVPGLVAVSVYRLLMPARGLVWGDALIQGLFYGSLNFVVLWPAITAISSDSYRSAHPLAAWAVSLLAILLLPAMWPVLLRGLFKSRLVVRRIQLPYPTAWDYFFDARGRFGNPMADTKGVLLRRDEYSYLELFKPPEE